MPVFWSRFLSRRRSSLYCTLGDWFDWGEEAFLKLANQYFELISKRLLNDSCSQMILGGILKIYHLHLLIRS